MNNKILQIFILCILTNAMYAQEYKQLMNDPSVNFYDVVKSAEAYFKTIDKDAKGSGYKPYMRWKYENEAKYYPSGVRNNSNPLMPNIAFKQYLESSAHKKTRALHSGWRDLGPARVDTITGHWAAGVGRMEDSWVSKTNPNKIFAVSRSGGFWRSMDGGATWQGGVCDTLPASGVKTLDVNPYNENEILISVQNPQNEYVYGIYKSVDGGLSFQPTNFHYTNPALGTGGLGSFFWVYRIKYHPLIPNLVFVGSQFSGGIYRSTNQLQTFNVAYNGTVTDINFHPTNPAIMYAFSPQSAATRNRIMISTDTGKTWTFGPLLPANGDEDLKLSTSPICPDCIYAGSGNGLYKSLDAGATFISMGNPLEYMYRGFAVSDVDTNIIVTGYVDMVRSTNGGQSWAKVTSWLLSDPLNVNPSNNNLHNNYKTSQHYVHADLNRVNCVNGVFYACTDGTLAKSTDGGATWAIVGEGIAVRENYGVGTSQSNHYVSYCGSQDNGQSLKLKDRWFETRGADGMRCKITPLNEKWITGSYQGGDRTFSRDGGITFSEGPRPQGQGEWIAPFLADPNNQMTYYDFKDSIFRTDDFGLTWNYVGKPNALSGDIYAAAIAHNDSKIMYISINNKIQKSTDGGHTFTDVTGTLPNQVIRYIHIAPNNDNVVAVVYGSWQNDGQKIFISNDGGVTWVNKTFNLTNMPLRSVIFDHTPAQNIYVGAEIGVFTMPLNGNSWTLLNTGLPNVSVLEMDINWGSNTLKAATWGRGLWETSLVGRQNYPAIVYTNITHPPTYTEPKLSVDEFVTSSIHYNGALSNVYTAWSFDSMSYSNIIPMTNISDSTWKTIAALPDGPLNAKIFFKVFAIGSAGDTSVTHKFEYLIRPFEYCSNTTDQCCGNLFIREVHLANISNVTNALNIGSTAANGGYTPVYFNNPVGQLFTDSTYTLSVKPWWGGYGDNDMAAWIDFDGDGVFNRTNEQILFAPNQTGDPITATFTVPTNANISDTLRMRVSHTYWENAASLNPCLDFKYGETEDYAIKISQINAPLNLQHLPLSTRPLDHSTALLNWNYNGDKIIEKYDVERSADGNSWTLEKSIVSTNLIHQAMSVKNNVQNGNLFRVKAIPTNGNYLYSNIVTATFSSDIFNQNLYIFPNPSTTTINVYSSAQLSENILVFDIQGRNVTPFIESTQLSANSANILIDQLANGVYFVQIGARRVKFIKGE